MNTDCIEKTILLRAPRARVWRALADPTEFETWFGFRLQGPFRPGASMRGVIVGTKVNPEIAKAQSQHQGLTMDIKIEKVQPEEIFSFWWHPHAIARDVDYSDEGFTLVEFVLREVPEGVLLTLTESGFDKVPLARRATAFDANSQGWQIMLGVLEEYVAPKPKAAEAR
jgi:uncharacterized protein YndB with AHSA1/START domain